jgi:hypothetical protein
MKRTKIKRTLPNPQRWGWKWNWTWGWLAAAILTMVLASGCGSDVGENGVGIRGPVPRPPVPSEIAEWTPPNRPADRPVPNFEGKEDPFQPLFRTETGGGGKSKPPVVDLNRFRLTALVQSPGGTVAILWEDGGRSHVVRAGTDLGRNIVVSEVAPDKLVLRAAEENAYGDPMVRTKELRLPGVGG